MDQIEKIETEVHCGSTEIVEMHLDGTLCERCGMYLGEATGKPRHCDGCYPDLINEAIKRRVNQTKSYNPANLDSAAAKVSRKSYWTYMAKQYPGCVQAYAWPFDAKKRAKKDRTELMQDAERRMQQGKAGLKFLVGMRNLVSGR